MSKNATTTEGWDQEYEGGRWSFLSSLPESGRYGIIGMWLSLTGTLEHVLDVGCGEALLYHRLLPMGLQSYTGLDLAPAALETAEVDPAKAQLKAGDMESFVPEGGQKFSAIVFNEVMYFSKTPADLLARYADFLTEDGVIAVSMYSPKRPESGANRAINMVWEATDDAERWEVLDDYRLVSDKKNVTWRLRLVKPVK